MPVELIDPIEPLPAQGIKKDFLGGTKVLPDKAEVLPATETYALAKIPAELDIKDYPEEQDRAMAGLDKFEPKYIVERLESALDVDGNEAKIKVNSQLLTLSQIDGYISSVQQALDATNAQAESLQAQLDEWNKVKTEIEK